MKPEELDRVVLEASVELDGKRKLSCARAFEIAERHGVAKKEIGKSCNRAGVRIAACQLGCFK